MYFITYFTILNNLKYFNKNFTMLCNLWILLKKTNLPQQTTNALNAKLWHHNQSKEYQLWHHNQKNVNCDITKLQLWHHNQQTWLTDWQVFDAFFSLQWFSEHWQIAVILWSLMIFSLTMNCTMLCCCYASLNLYLFW